MVIFYKPLFKMDFTLKTYIKLLITIRNSGYSFKTIQDFVVNPSGKIVMLRHDSDIWPKNDLQMAIIENNMGISSTYYFRIPSTYNESIIRRIRDLGHEIGYHYEDLATYKGDYTLAIDSFKRNLEKIRELYDVKTVSMHGRPLSKWDSRELWNKYKLSDFGIITEPYLDIDYRKVLYLTENGNRWDGEKVNIRDKVNSHFNFKIKTTFDLMRWFQKNELPDQIILNVHPARWNDNIILWVYRFFLQKAKNIAKFFLNKIRGN
jgi:hypothetical protein